MNGLQSIGRFLVIAGTVLLVAGLIAMAAGRLGLPIGRLPGDFSFKGKHVTVFAPIGSMIVLSLVLTFILNVLTRWFK